MTYFIDFDLSWLDAERYFILYYIITKYLLLELNIISLNNHITNDWNEKLAIALSTQ